MTSEMEMTQEAENKSFATRVWELPVAMAAVEQLSQIYSSVKERNAVTRMACNAGESTIQMATAATKPIIDAANNCSLSKPIVGKVECAAATIDRVASETLAKVEEKCPIITKTPTEIKTAVTGTASDYYSKLQDSAAVKMMVARTGDVLSTFELIGELTLPTDGKCEEDMKELETDDADHEKGHLVRARNLHKKLARRGKRKLMSYQPIKFTVDTMSNLQDKVTDLVGKSSGAGKKVYNATMYIPGMALELSGNVIVSAKDFVFALHKAHPIKDMPATIANCVMKAVQPLSDAKDKLVGHVFVPPQVMTEYLLSSRPIQWIIPHIVAVEDINKMDITMEEIEDTTESEGNENGKDS